MTIKEVKILKTYFLAPTDEELYQWQQFMKFSWHIKSIHLKATVLPSGVLNPACSTKGKVFTSKI